MRVLGLSCLIGMLALVSLHAEPAGRPFFSRVLNIFGSKKEQDASIKRTKSLTLTLSITPEPVKLPETRRLAARLDIKNHSKRHVRLEFPNTQRFEALIREKNGKPLVLWSEDQSFSSEPGYLTINPGEHLKYTAMLPTRDLTAGRLYEVEMFLPNYPELRVTRSVVPVN